VLDLGRGLGPFIPLSKFMATIKPLTGQQVSRVEFPVDDPTFPLQGEELLEEVRSCKA
jgi:hypothetical protein